ncbi:MAG: HNH endonuclease [Nonomuraea sp.]|nr:HNH endonuclease [Nonomuraea sp.]
MVIALPLLISIHATPIDELAKLKVARPYSLHGYSHKRFMPRWAHHRGSCDSRETVLARDGHRVRRNKACHPVRGVWYSPYDGRRMTHVRQADVDHLVPLANAWVSGANRWSQARRRAFANDLTRPELLTVSHSANLAKGGSSPSTWRPQRRSYWCRYARNWITVKRHYRLNVTWAEKRALANMLRTC